MANGVLRSMPNIEMCESQYLPTNIDSKRMRLGKNIWGKMSRCYCEHIGGTHYEPIGNFMGTSWEQKNAKNPSLNLPQKIVFGIMLQFFFG
jgi:hypothetical protein